MESSSYPPQLAAEHSLPGNCDYRLSFNLKLSYLSLPCAVRMVVHYHTTWVCHSLENDLKGSRKCGLVWLTPALARATSVSVPIALVGHGFLQSSWRGDPVLLEAPVAEPWQPISRKSILRPGVLNVVLVDTHTTGSVVEPWLPDPCAL